MSISRNSLKPLALALLIAGALCASAAKKQDDLIGPKLIGTIPGTNMQRDEFRSRALVQLTAVALDALAYRLTHKNYPANFPELMGSDCYNLKPTNMFSGQRVRAVFFEPTGRNMTDEPVLGIPLSQDLPRTPYVPDSPSPGNAGSSGDTGGDAGDAGSDGDGGGGGSSGGGSGDSGVIGGLDPSKLEDAFRQAGMSGALRVDPKDISGYEPGDIFYYTDGKLLQLVMFAPDGTYVEYVDDAPNANRQRQLEANLPGMHFPDDVFAAQVLYFTDRLLPQLYNLVMYMSSHEPIPLPQFAQTGAGERLALAEQLGITVQNPLTRTPAKLTSAFSVGDFIDPDPAQLVPLHLCCSGGRVLTHAELTAGRAAAEQPREQSKAPEKPKKPARPPMGGRK